MSWTRIASTGDKVIGDKSALQMDARRGVDYYRPGYGHVYDHEFDHAYRPAPAHSYSTVWAWDTGNQPGGGYDALNDQYCYSGPYAGQYPCGGSQYPHGNFLTYEAASTPDLLEPFPWP